MKMKKHFVTEAAPRTILVVTLGVVLATTAGCRPFGIAQGVTAARIRQLAPGMSESDVRAQLGPPLAIRPWGANAHLLDYAIETPLAHHSPNLWVSVRDGRVEQVEASRSNLWHLDSEGLYVSRSGLHWEAPTFAQTFK